MHKFLFLLISLFFFSTSAQQTDYVDFTKIKAVFLFDTNNKKVLGKQQVTFSILKNTKEVYLDARNFENAIFNSKNDKIKLKTKNSKIYLESNFKEGNEYTVNFEYEVQPKKALYFWGWDEKNINKTIPNHKQIWTQGQGKYTSHWLPSIDDMNDKILFELTFQFDKNYEVISNGKLISSEENDDNTKSWHYQTAHPMSSYLVALAIGKYDVKTTVSTSCLLYTSPSPRD